MRRLGSYITQGVYTVSGPFHPFGGAVDIVVVEQQDGTFQSSPWYVRFGKFQGVLKAREKIVDINVNGVDADFHMHLDHKGEAFFLREIDAKDGGDSVIYPSSGDDTDDNRARDNNNMQSLRSKSCNFDSEENGKVVARTSSRRSQILGLVFGRRSFRGEGEEGGDVKRVDSLERAEIAADLLELKWSTNINSDHRPPHKDKRKTVKSSSEGDQMDNGLHQLEVKEEACSCSNTNVELGQEKTVIKIDVAHEVECDPNGKEGAGDHECTDFPIECVEVEAGMEKQLSGEKVAGASTLGAPSDVVSVEDISVDGVQSVVCCETLESSQRVLDCSTEKVESNYVTRPFGYSSLDDQTIHENDIKATTRSSSASLEEQNFLFSDLDESRINDQFDGSISPESVDKEGHLSYENGNEKVDHLVYANCDLHSSSPMAIPRNEAAVEEVGHTGSLPNIASHSGNLGQHDVCYALSQSLDSKSKSLPWAFPGNDDSKCPKSDEAKENQLSHEEPDAKDSSGEFNSTFLKLPLGKRTYVNYHTKSSFVFVCLLD